MKEVHPYIQFTMEASTNNRLPFIGMEIIKTNLCLPKMTNKGHFEEIYYIAQSACPPHQTFFFQKGNNLNGIYILKLRYTVQLINFTIHNFSTLQTRVSPHQSAHQTAPLRVIIPIKDQKSVEVVRRRLRDLGRKINLLFHDSNSCNARTHLFCKCNVKYVTY